jgi:hypothetical protein
MFISQVKVTPDDDAGSKADQKLPNRFDFLVTLPSGKTRTYYLSADSADERAAWIAALKKWVGHVDEVTRRATLAFVAESEAERGGKDDDDDDMLASTAASSTTHSARAPPPSTSMRLQPVQMSEPAAKPAAAAVSIRQEPIAVPPAAAAAAPAPVLVPPTNTGGLSPTNPFAPPPVQLSQNNPFAPLVAMSPTNPFASASSTATPPVQLVALSPTATRIIAEGDSDETVQKQLERAAEEYAEAQKAAIVLDPGFKEIDRHVERFQFDGGFEEVTTVTASDGKGTTKTYKNTVRVRAGTAGPSAK